MDTNETNESVDVGRGIDRRTMLKASVAAGTVAATWVAPRIETLGFAPAAAAGSGCVIMSIEGDDKNSHGSSDCGNGNHFPPPCCGQSFGSSANSPDTFTFTNPTLTCTEIVVRTIGLPDCDATLFDPDIGAFGVVISSTSGTGCDDCHISDVLLLNSTHRTIIKSIKHAGTTTCSVTGGQGVAVNASLSCTDPDLIAAGNDARIAVQITCTAGIGCLP